MIFETTDKLRIKAKKKRQRYEKNFRIMNIVQGLSFLSFLVVLLSMIYTNCYEGIGFLLYGVVLSIFLTLTIAMHFAKSFVSGTHITDMYEEKLELNDRELIHSYNLSLGGGYLEGLEGHQRKYEHIYLQDIKDCMVDEKTGRIEIIADIQIIITYYEQIQTQMMSPNHRLIMYDYYQPSLIKALQNANVQLRKTKIIYKVNETPEKYRGVEGRKRLNEDIKNGKGTWI